jgi:hypothetical protein
LVKTSSVSSKGYNNLLGIEPKRVFE